MSRQLAPVVDPEWYLWGGSTRSFFAQSYSRLGTNLAARLIAGSTAMHTSIIFLEQGDVVSNINMVCSGAGSSGTPDGFVALYDTAGALMSQSAAIGTHRAANTAYTHPLLAPVTIPVTGIYRIACSFTAGSMPTFYGPTVVSNVNDDVFGLPNLFQTSNTGLTSVAPATIGTPTRISTGPWYLLT